MPEGTHRRHKAAGFDRAPSWHELVQPGPKGSEKRRKERAAAARVVTVEKPFTGANRATRRAIRGRGWNPGRLVLHRTRLHPVDGGPRPNVRALRAIRALTKAGR